MIFILLAWFSKWFDKYKKKFAIYIFWSSILSSISANSLQNMIDQSFKMRLNWELKIKRRKVYGLGWRLILDEKQACLYV